MRRYTMGSRIERPSMYKPTVIRESISCIPLPIVKKAQDKLKVTLKNRCNIKFPEPNSSSRSSEFESASISGNNNINNHNNTSAITSNNNSNNTNNYNTPPHNSAYRGRCHTMSDISEFSANRSNASVKSLSCDFLNCSLCNQKYHKPKILPCLHTFCEKCLLTDIPAHSIAATCPLCDQPSILPPGGVTELQNNDFVTSLTADSTSCQHRTDNKMAVSCVQCCITMCELCARLHDPDHNNSPFKIDVYEDNGVRLRSRSTSRIPAQISSLLSPGSHANAAKSSVNRRQGSSGNISTSTPQGKRRALKRPSSYNSQKIRTFEFFSTGDDLYARIGEKGRNRGQFTNPQGVACGNVCQEAGAVPGEELGRSEIDDSYSTMYVTDSNNQCVQAFNIQTGELKMKFGARGRLPGQLLRPTGITVTQRNNVLVADYDNQCVNVYSAVDGKFKRFFLSHNVTLFL